MERAGEISASVAPKANNFTPRLSVPKGAYSAIRTSPDVLDSAEAVIRSKLEDGEELVWSGMPKQGLLLQATDVIAIPASLLWGGFALYWEYEVVSTHQFWVLQLWGIPFVLLGLFMIVGRFFTDSALRAHTYYGLTDKRILIEVNDKVQSYPLSDISGIGITTSSDRSGTLAFGVPGTPVPTNMSAIVTPTRVNFPTFTMIADAQSVYDQIEAQRKTYSEKNSLGPGY